MPIISYSCISFLDTGILFRCESLNFASNECIPTTKESIVVRSIRLVKQLSVTACKLGENFGVRLSRYDDDSGLYFDKIWVDKGCRGDFIAEVEGNLYHACF